MALNDAFLAKCRAEAEEFRLYAEFADQYSYIPEESPVLAGTERLVQWGGDGTPGVAEFCTLELAAALRQSEEAVRLHIAHALAVRHRLPNTWAVLMDGRLRVWQATELASATWDLSYEQAVELDRDLPHWLNTMAFGRVLEFIKACVKELLHDPDAPPPDETLARRRVEINTRGINNSGAGVADVSATIDTADAIFLDAQLNRLAEILAHGGNRESQQVRRAQALGLLATPARALQLLQAALTDELPTEDEGFDAQCPARGQRGHSCGTITVDPDQLLPRSELVVHLTDTTLRSGDGLIKVEKAGSLLAGWVKHLTGNTRISVRPVLNPDELAPTDAYHVPARMREWITLRNPHEAFPYSKKPSRGLDLDHTIPWTPPRPGQEPLTRPDNLAPLSRKVHRAKTHGGWRLSQPSPGTYLWKSPLGFGYLVTPSHTWLIEDPTGQILPRPDNGADTTAA
ncbi:DUF222 domain-containing protein [Propionibacteriaceae bacterium G57]|uniref:HNH endonuclease signature motif containing protein n=1 Tax=Aestuariimicrobium sp. G57 TaxID=3418485 RepID=UPI003DA6D439